jgi:hypothetical protein
MEGLDASCGIALNATEHGICSRLAVPLPQTRSAGLAAPVVGSSTTLKSRLDKASSTSLICTAANPDLRADTYIQ